MPSFNSSSQSKGIEFLKGETVKGFPKLPLYQEAKIIETYGSSVGYGASAFTDDDISKVLEFYETSLGSAGWEYTLKQKEKDNYVYSVKNSQYEGLIILNTASDGKRTAITLSVSQR